MDAPKLVSVSFSLVKILLNRLMMVRYIIQCRNEQSAQYKNHTKNSSHFENIYYLFRENEDNDKIK